jgi:hypothetical protein
MGWTRESSWSILSIQLKVYLPCASAQDFKPPIHMSESDFVSLTANRTICDAHGCIGFEDFDRIMRQQLTAYTQAILSRSLISSYLLSIAYFHQLIFRSCLTSALKSLS